MYLIFLEKSVDFIEFNIPIEGVIFEGLSKNYFMSVKMKTIKDRKFFGDMLKNVSVIRMEIDMKRALTGHFLQTFLPSMMLCTVSTGSIFIPSHIVPGRMGLAITSFLSLISLFNGARSRYFFFSDTFFKFHFLGMIGLNVHI